ncbi:hypothetical protein BGZ58_010503 [Dissophora ornata]|nr:hypothetical protein BGZ58_010503 [Dissophora ornata]
MSTHNLVAVSPHHHFHTTPSGLTATLELESDTVEIYDRSNEAFQYSLKGSVELDWSKDSELLLKDARIDFMGYADTAVLRYEAGAGGSSIATETPVHHTHDFIPTPMILGNTTSSTPLSRDTTAVVEATHHDSLPIDLTLPGHLPDTIDLTIGTIRYELQVSLELTFARGTSTAVTEQFILRRPVLVHRIVYPSAHLQPRLALGLDSGGVEIQIKVPRLLHCENTLLAVELYAKPRTRNVKLRKAKVVFEQIETDRHQRTSPLAAVPKAVVPLASPALQHHSSASSPPPFRHVPLSAPQSTGLPPPPRLLTQAIAQPLEVDFEEPTAELEAQNLQLQLVLSPNLCVDVQSSWLQISHALRVEIEYTTDDESYVTNPPSSAPPSASAILIQDPDSGIEESDADHESQGQVPVVEDQELASTIWDQEGDAIETETIDQENIEVLDNADAKADDEWSKFTVDEKKDLQDEEGSGSSTVAAANHHIQAGDMMDGSSDVPPPVTSKATDDSHLSPYSPGSTSSSYTYSVASEEIPVRVVRVVSTTLVDATTLAQAAGEMEAGLPTYESVIEATGLPAYAEEKPEDDHEEAEASGTATGVLGGAARRLEGEDADIERR